MKKIAPWHAYAGAPNFPTHGLYNPNSSFGNPTELTLKFNSSGALDSIEGKNSSNSIAKVSFS
jgi:hypothetical protein